MGIRTVHVRVTTSLERFRPLLCFKVEVENKHIYAKEKRPGAGPKPSACDLPSAIYNALQAKTPQLIHKGLPTLPLKFYNKLYGH